MWWILWSAVAQAQTVSWSPCSLDPTGDDGLAECATLVAPLDHEGTTTDTIALALKRIPAREPPRGQLWFLTGGPGDSGTWDLANLEGVSERLPDLDLVTLDPRGVRDSEPEIGCPEQEADDSTDGFEVVEDEWPACLAHVQQAHGDVLPYLTTTQTAHDVLLAVDAVRGPEDAVMLWGVSYGTFLVNRVLQLRPDGWDGVVIDGVVPSDWSFTTLDGNVDLAARDHLALCADQADCRDHLGTDPVAFAEDLLARLEDGHCERLGLDADLTRLVHGVFLMGGEPFNTLIPPMLARLDRCKPRDIHAFVSLFDTLFPEDGDGAVGEEEGRHDPVLQRHIAYTDLWSTTPPRSELQAVVDNSIGTTQVSLNFAEIADEWPVAAVGPLHGEPAVTDVPVLMLHGGLDPTMPLEEADRVFRQFTGPNQTAVAVPHAFHVAFNAGDCPVDMTLGFFEDPRLPVDDACVADMEPTDFSGFGDFHGDVWGTDDRWGDQGCGGCSGTGSGGPWWLAGMLLPSLRRRRRVGSR